MQTMRTLRMMVLIPLVLMSVLFLIRYARELYPLCQGIGGTVFLREPYMGTYRYAGDQHTHWSPFLAGDGPGEGTRVVEWLPTWPLVVAAVGVLVYAILTIPERKEKPGT